jgi:hypothetical protein
VFPFSGIFRPGTCDEEFHRLDDATQAVTHKEAKASYDRWHDGCQIVVAEVRTAYGDGRPPHITTPIANIRPPVGGMAALVRRAVGGDIQQWNSRSS